jgi:hypothetical protein
MQKLFSGLAEFQRYTKKTQREQLLDDMKAVMPLGRVVVAG